MSMGGSRGETGPSTLSILKKIRGEQTAIRNQVAVAIRQGKFKGAHADLSGVGTNTHTQVDTHIADGTKHFLEGAIDHTNILNIGSNAHSVIDTHLASTANPHSVDVTDVSPLSTKGDVFVYGAADDRLPIGTDTHVLTADSNEVLGVKWAAAAGGVQDSDDPVTWTGAHTFSKAGTALTVTNSAQIQNIGVGIAPNANYGIYINEGTYGIVMAKPFYCTKEGAFGVNPTAETKLRLLYNASAAGTHYALNASGALTGSGSQTYYGVAMSSSYNGSNAAGNVYGAYMQAQVGASSLSNCTGAVLGGYFVSGVTGDSNTTTTAQFRAGKFWFLTGPTADSNTLATAEACFAQMYMTGTNNTVTSGSGLMIGSPEMTGSGEAVTTAHGLKLNALASIPAITTYYGVHVGDQTDVSITNNHAVYVDAQDGANQGAAVANIEMAGGDWNTGHVQLNTGHAWATGGVVRAQGSAPSSATDASLHVGDDAISFLSVTTPVAQQAHIIDADGNLADITTKFNTLLAQLEAYGLLASS